MDAGKVADANRSTLNLQEFEHFLHSCLGAVAQPKDLPPRIGSLLDRCTCHTVALCEALRCRVCVHPEAAAEFVTPVFKPAVAASNKKMRQEAAVAQAAVTAANAKRDALNKAEATSLACKAKRCLPLALRLCD